VVEALGDHEDRIRYENTRQKLAAGITKKRRKYEPRDALAMQMSTTAIRRSVARMPLSWR
jgi:hypothetical protein